MSFDRYLKVIKEDFRPAIKVEWLNPDESVNFEFTNALYEIDVDLSVNYTNGSRRSCTLTLNNDRNVFPVDFDNIWIGQKFKLWMGIYLDEKNPYYFPQGVFYVTNPEDVYNPDTRTVTINGTDKWVYLDGTLFGRLSGTYQTNIDVNLYSATRELLRSSRFDNKVDWEPGSIATNGNNYTFPIRARTINFLECKRYTSVATSGDVQIALRFYDSNKNIIARDNEWMEDTVNISDCAPGEAIYFRVIARVPGSDGGEDVKITNENITIISDNVSFVYIPKEEEMVDPIPPLLSPYFLTKETYVLTADTSRDIEKTYYEYSKDSGEYVEYTGDSLEGKYVKKHVWDCPYTATVERGQTLADVLLEYATILCANIYYDVNGRLVLEPMIDTAEDITDTNKEILWHYTVDEKTFLGLSQKYDFEKIHNDFIVLGNIVNGYQFKGRVQNRNPLSNTCVQKIGLRTREPYEDNQYYSDEQCVELAKYYAKTDTVLQKSGDISSVTLYHLDVNKLVTVSTPNNNMSKELFLITGFSLSASGEMTLNVSSVNILQDFSVVEATVYD